MRLLVSSVLLAAVSVSAPAAAEALYKCDAAGAITIQSDPCPRGATQVWKRETTPEPAPSTDEIAARTALAQAEAQRLAEEARIAQQVRIDELIRRDEEERAAAAEASGRIPKRKSDCTLAHEFADAATAKEWLNLSQTQRDRLKAWVVDTCRDPGERARADAERAAAEPVTL